MNDGLAWIVGRVVVAHAGADAERILDERYARREIDDEEFSHRRAVLRGQETPDLPAGR